MYYRRACFKVGHILQDNLLYRGTLLYEDRFDWKACPIGSHVLHEGMSYRWTGLAGVHVDEWTYFLNT